MMGLIRVVDPALVNPNAWNRCEVWNIATGTRFGPGRGFPAQDQNKLRNAGKARLQASHYPQQHVIVPHPKARHRMVNGRPTQ